MSIGSRLQVLYNTYILCKLDVAFNQIEHISSQQKVSGGAYGIHYIFTIQAIGKHLQLMTTSSGLAQIMNLTVVT